MRHSLELVHALPISYVARLLPEFSYSFLLLSCFSFFFFFNDPPTTEIYTLSLHDALPISVRTRAPPGSPCRWSSRSCRRARSEEHTSELQSRQYLVCRLLLEKKKTSNLAYMMIDHTRPKPGNSYREYLQHCQTHIYMYLIY